MSALVVQRTAAVELFVSKIGTNLDYLAPFVGGELLDRPTRQTIEVRLADWFDRFGVTAADVTEACRAMVDPNTLGKIKGRPTLLAVFSEEVGKAQRRRLHREQADRQARERAERDQAPRGETFSDEQRRALGIFRPETPVEVLDVLAGIGTPVGGGRRARREPVRGKGHGEEQQGRDLDGAAEAARREPGVGEGEDGDGGEAAAGAEAVEQRPAEGEGDAQAG